jgi:hypothetical protein
MNKPNEQTIKRLWQTLLITMAAAATFHLIIVAITAGYKHDMGFLNPLDFLGLSVVFPQYRNSQTAAGFGWLALTALFFGILYIGFHYHLYLAIIRDSKVVKQITKVTSRLKSK